MNHDRQYAIVSIDNFPSRHELISILNDFLTQNNFLKDYTIECRSNILDIIFTNEKIARLCINRLTQEKSHNELYSRMTIGLILKEVSKRGRKSSNNTIDRSQSLPRNQSFSGISMKLRNRLNTQRKYKSIDASLNEEENKSNYSKMMIRSLKEKSGVITCDSPYKTALDIEREKEKENKMKWICNKLFNPYIGKKTIDRQYDPLNCYVRLTPSIPTSNYLFRQKQKEKWIVNNDFKKHFKS